MTDLFEVIRKNWMHTDRSDWIVCLAAAKVVGLRDGATERIANENHVSEDTVERRARAGRTYLAMRKQYPEAANLRNQLRFAYFEAIGRKIEGKVMNYSEAYERLMEAAQDKTLIQQFRGSLPISDDVNTEFEKHAWKLHEYAKKHIINAPSLGVPQKWWKRVRDAVQIACEAIEERKE
jgi:hypothetical protein